MALSPRPATALPPKTAMEARPEAKPILGTPNSPQRQNPLPEPFPADYRANPQPTYLRAGRYGPWLDDPQLSSTRGNGRQATWADGSQQQSLSQPGQLHSLASLLRSSLAQPGPIPLAELHQLKATQDRGSKVVATNLAVFRHSPLAPQWPAPHGLLTIDVSKG